MNNNKRLLGAHMSISGGFYKAIERGESIGCTCIQIFTGSNKQWRTKEIELSDAKRFLEAQNQSSVQLVVAHAKYLINIGSPQKDTERKSITALIESLKQCHALNIPYLILHPGAALKEPVQKCIEQVARNLDYCLEKADGDTKILLENTAGQGSVIGHSFEQLNAIITLSSHHKELGVCLDTCHAFAAGYDLTSQEGFDQMLDSIKKTIGLSKIKAMHINDSKYQCGSKKDRHRKIGDGYIGRQGFECILNNKHLATLPTILETPTGDNPLQDYHYELELLKRLSKSVER